MADTAKPLEVLALQGRSASLQRLATGLREAGLRVDLVDDLEQLRDAFFTRGGHDALVIGPDVRGALARRAVECLAGVDGGVRVLVFGGRIGREPQGRPPDAAILPTPHASAFHPSSRAGLGAVLRLLREDFPRSA